jgi:hypothetical protein
MNDITRAILAAESCTADIEIEGTYIGEHQVGLCRPSGFSSKAYVDFENNTLVLEAFRYLQIPLDIVDDEFAFKSDGDECAFLYTIDAIFVTDRTRVW